MTESIPRISVMFTCRDMKASTRFYSERLGFKMKESWPDADNPAWANMVLDGQSIMLGMAMEPAKVGEMCQGNAEKEAYWKKASQAYLDNQAGVGVIVYVQVADVDAYHATLKDRGVEVPSEPETQFYGIRDFGVDDPDGYRLLFFTPVSMTSCQSCGMPMKDAKAGEMFCQYCTDEKGSLRSYEQVFEGTVTGYFMGMQKMPREQAEKAAVEHLSRMPAWASRGK